jgi:ankyrin repeat protein
MKWLVDISMNGTAKYFISDFDNNIIGIHSQYDIISSTNIENAFISACYCGNIESAKWLYLQSNINISSKNEHAFRYACMHGYLELAKWLLETKPDINISAVDNFAFAYAHPNVIDWLLQIKPMLNLTIKNEKLHLQQYKIDFPL